MLASGTALSLMGGAVGVHYFHVKETVASSKEALYDGVAYASYESGAGSPLSRDPGGEGLGLTAGGVDETLLKSEKEVTMELLQKMVDRIEDLTNENQNLRDEQVQLREQVAETNRDLSHLQFRVDTHSESFRPLRVTEDSTFQKALPVHPVLPPKNW